MLKQILSKSPPSSTLSQFLRRFLSSVPKNPKIGIIGCGNVGNAVANNLKRKGHSVTGMFDLDKSKMAAMPENIKACSSPREVVEMADVFVTGLPKPMHVMAAAEGKDGILAGLSRGKVWIDHSTTDYEQTLGFQREAEKVGAQVLEAPITGGLMALQKGQMIVYLGGDKVTADAVKPILEASYSEIFYVGEIGAAMIVKVVSNMLAALNVVAAGEVLLMAKRANIDLKRFWDGIRLSAGNSFAWETGVPVIFNGEYDPGFTMELLCKDLQLGYDIARKLEVPIDLNHLTLAICRRTQFQMGDHSGCYATPKIYEDAINECLNIPNFKDWTYENKVINGSIHVEHKNIKG